MNTSPTASSSYELDERQFDSPAATTTVPKAILGYINDFDAALSEDEYNNPGFSYRLLFTRKLANRPGQADRVVEFLDQLRAREDHRKRILGQEGG